MFLYHILALQGGSIGVANPFSAPVAKVHVPPPHNYDLLNLRLDLDVDYPHRLLKGTAANTLRTTADNVRQIRFHAGQSTKVDSVRINGRRSSFKRDGEGILVDCRAGKPGTRLRVVVEYHLRQSDTPRGQGVPGWIWHPPQRNDPSREGFLTRGEYADTRDWAVTWDYPNDFATTETHTTVPLDWTVIGNGVQTSDRKNGSRHTVVWKMKQPHATYLTSLAAGPFDVQLDSWRGIPLMYVAPRGPRKGSKAPNDVGFELFSLRRNDAGKSVAYTVAHTKDMLDYFSSMLGVKYPWPKYAQTFAYDFNEGLENVSATSLGNFITSPRQSYYGSDWILSHELAHQWFGDYVTCTDWSDLWLNEGLANFMEIAYLGHSRGRHVYLRYLDWGSASYFSESRDYKRPVVTNFYKDPGVMFDEHTYNKGQVLLASLRSSLGEKAFFKGLHLYLTRNRNSPVTTQALCKAMSTAAGRDLNPWFQQWIYKPGHPVIDWSWEWQADSHEVVVHVKQVQDTSKGTPIYTVDSHVGLLRWGDSHHVRLAPIKLRKAEEVLRIKAATKPEAVVFDPEHDFLREIPKQPWSTAELPVIAAYDPNPLDKQSALNKMIGNKPSDEALRTAEKLLRKDQSVEPEFLVSITLGMLKREDLRSFWHSELRHPNYSRRAQAVTALGLLPRDAGTVRQLRALVTDTQPYDVVSKTVATLGSLDYSGSRELFLRLAKTSLDEPVRTSAMKVLVENKAAEAANLVFRSVEETQPYVVQVSGFRVLEQTSLDDPRLVPLLRKKLQSDDYLGFVFEAVAVARNRKMKELLPELRSLHKRVPFAAEIVAAAITDIEKVGP